MGVFISVVMPVYLGDYDGAAKGREEKFKRAVRSFLQNIFNESELVIVSDGCDEAENIYNSVFSKYKQIKFYKIPKQPLFSGVVRQYGLEKSTGKYIAYLDSDDVIGEWHLYKIYQELKRFRYPEWVYYDDFIVSDIRNIAKKKVSLKHGSIGTSSICHKRDMGVSWDGCDGYGHDWIFVKKLIEASPNPIKIETPQYFIHHIPNSVDF